MQGIRPPARSIRRVHQVRIDYPSAFNNSAEADALRNAADKLDENQGDGSFDFLQPVYTVPFLSFGWSGDTGAK